MILDPVYKHLEVACFAGDCHSGIAGQASDNQLGCNNTQRYLQSVIGQKCVMLITLTILVGQPVLAFIVLWLSYVEIL